MESKLDEVEAHLSDSSSAPRDMASPAYAEAMVTVLEQVAALRYIGSQTHPAIQQMVLAHEAQLQQISEQLDSVASSAAGQAASAALSSTAEIKERMARLEGQVRGWVLGCPGCVSHICVWTRGRGPCTSSSER